MSAKHSTTTTTSAELLTRLDGLQRDRRAAQRIRTAVRREMHRVLRNASRAAHGVQCAVWRDWLIEELGALLPSRTRE
jgi:hypothetical protein